MHLNATDLKVSIQCNLNVNLIKSGSITIPAKRLLQIIKELPDQPIHISVNSKNQININCGNSQFKITGLPKEEYPPITFFKDTSFVLNQKEFKNMLKKVSILLLIQT
jgi:DNA polymerase-3 subunit beta